MAKRISFNKTVGVTFLAPQTLAIGNRVLVTVDNRNKLLARIGFRVGRTGGTAFAVGASVFIDRFLNDGAAMVGGPTTPIWSTPIQLAAAAVTTVSGTSSAGQYELKLTSVTGLAVGDTVSFHDSTAAVRLGFGQIVKLTAPVYGVPGVTLLNPLPVDFLTSDVVANKADVFAECELGEGYYRIGVEYIRETNATQPLVVAALGDTINYAYDETV